MKIFIGHDPVGERVAVLSMLEHSTIKEKPKKLSYEMLGHLYTRPTEWRDTSLWDTISGAPMTTTHAIARFFIPLIVGYKGWALFVDGDVMFRKDVGELLKQKDPRYAIQVVQHSYIPKEGPKKGNQTQTMYRRKNWSSVMLINCEHPSNWKLSLHDLNNWPGRDLHQFFWLASEEIGDLSSTWNHLVGHYDNNDPAIVHYTNGLPCIPGHENDQFANEWRAYGGE